MAKFFPQKAMNGESSRLKVSYMIEEGLNHARVQFRNYSKELDALQGPEVVM